MRVLSVNLGLPREVIGGKAGHDRDLNEPVAVASRVRPAATGIRAGVHGVVGAVHGPPIDGMNTDEASGDASRKPSEPSRR